ncbi:MAG: hypothetical protein QM820_40840 [Minicystis sp.]
MIYRTVLTLVSVLSIGSSSVACADKPGTTAPAHTADAVTTAATGQGPGAKLQPLKHYLGGAVKAKVTEMGTDASGKPAMNVTRELGEIEVKDRLAAIDLDQLPDGPLMRCPTTAQVRFEDKDGHVLGTLGSCGGAWRFDAPDGTHGGVRIAADPIRGPVCTPGMDQTCNDLAEISSIHGTCNPNHTCTCKAGFALNPATGRCK